MSDDGRQLARSKGGRPTKLTPEVQDRLCAAIRSGATLDTACAYAHLGRRTLAQWMDHAEQHPRGKYWELRQAIEAALAHAEMAPLATLNQLRGHNDGHVAVRAASVLLDRLDRRAGPRMSRDDVAKEIVAPIYDAAGVLYRERLAAVVATLRSGLNGSSDSPAARAALDVLAEAMSPVSIEGFRVQLAEAASEAVAKAPWRG